MSSDMCHDDGAHNNNNNSNSNINSVKQQTREEQAQEQQHPEQDNMTMHMMSNFFGAQHHHSQNHHHHFHFYQNQQQQHQQDGPGPSPSGDADADEDEEMGESGDEDEVEEEEKSAQQQQEAYFSMVQQQLAQFNAMANGSGSVDPQQTGAMSQFMQWMGSVPPPQVGGGASGVQQEQAQSEKDEGDAQNDKQQQENGGDAGQQHGPMIVPPEMMMMMMNANPANAMDPASQISQRIPPHAMVPPHPIMMHPSIMYGMMPPPFANMMMSPHQMQMVHQPNGSMESNEPSNQSPSLHSMENSVLQQSAMLSATLSPQSQTAASVSGVIMPGLLQSSRQWQLHILQPNKILYPKNLKINITMRIRGEEARCFVPDRLYSSHRYVIQHALHHDMSDTTTTPSSQDNSKDTPKISSLWEKYPLLIGKCTCVNALDRSEEIKRKNGQPILKGEPEAAITRTVSKEHEGKTVLEGTMKVQFTDVSYHHDKKHFALRINYMDPQKLDNPLFYVLSPPFTVYARKPSNTGAETLGAVEQEQNQSGQKRKKKTKDKKKKKAKETPQPETSETKTNAINDNYSNEDLKRIVEQSPAREEFNKRVEEIMAMKARLALGDREQAHARTLNKLLEIDPEYKENFFAREWE